MKKLNSRYFKGSQSLEYTELLEHNGEKLQIHIDRDSVKQQSSATIWIWSETKWNLVSRIPYSAMSVVINEVYYGLKVDTKGRLVDVAIKHFEEDITELKRLAKLILD